MVWGYQQVLVCCTCSSIFYPLLTAAWVVNRFIAEKHWIKCKEKATKEALLVLQKQMEEQGRLLVEKILRLLRLCKQKEVILSKRKDIVIQGLQDLNKLECVEQEELEVVVDVQASSSVDVINQSAVFFNEGSSFSGPIAAIEPGSLRPSWQSLLGLASPGSNNTSKVGGGSSLGF